MFRRSHCRERERGRARARGARARPHRDDDVERDRVAVFPTRTIGRSCRESVVSLCPHSDFSLPAALEATAGPGQARPAMCHLFSPLLAVAGLSLQTLLRVVPRAAEGQDFFPKDTMDF